MKLPLRRLLDLLAPLGLLVVVGALAWARSGRTLPGGLRPYLIAGAALVLVHAVLRWEDIASRIGRRQMRYGANTFVFSLAVLALLGGINYLAYNNTKRWDLTKGQRYSLSDQTRKILAGLKEDVKITYFQRASAMGPGEDRLKEYQAASPRIKAEFVDPIAKPAKARDYDITLVPTLVVERGGKREKVGNDSEQDITNALIKITREGKKTVCFLEGEGEKSIDDFGDQGLSGAKNALGKSQYETRKVVLLQEARIPEDCTIVVVAGPRKDPLPAAIDLVRGFVRGGGKALIMIEPEMRESYPNLQGLLKEWSLETAKDVVLDVSLQSQLAGTGPLTPLAAQYPYHEITKDFRLASAFHTARSVKAGTGTVEGVSAQNLVETSSASWAETDLRLREPVEMNPGQDTKGPVSLAAVATIRVSEPLASSSPSPAPSPSPSPGEGEPEEPKKEGRVVAFGDSDFASNAFLGFPGNQDLFLNTVAWLGQDTDLISIRPKEPEDQRLFLTRQQQQNVAWLALVVLPGAFIVAGVVTWWRRR